MTDMEFTPEQRLLANIFYPHMMTKMCAAKENNTRLVHYTSASAAMEIIKTKRFWMRKTSCMNDFMEVEQGLHCLDVAYSGEAGELLKETLNDIFLGVVNQIEEFFRGWVRELRTNAYIACFSEHSETEDMHGRLSMWRAYSESTGVALVLNNAPFFSQSNALKIYTSPVAYLDAEAFQTEFAKTVQGINNNADFLRRIGRDELVFHVFNAFKFAALCTKHPGFLEENEWRVIYTPSLEESERLEKDIEVLRGTPQPVYKIPLKNIPEEGLVGVEIPEILDRVLIGPTEYPVAILEAFITLLADAGVEDPQSRMQITGIPLRL